MQEAVQAARARPLEEAASDGLRSDLAVLLEEHGRAEAACLYVRRGGLRSERRWHLQTCGGKEIAKTLFAARQVGVVARILEGSYFSFLMRIS